MKNYSVVSPQGFHVVQNLRTIEEARDVCEKYGEGYWISEQLWAVVSWREIK